MPQRCQLSAAAALRLGAQGPLAAAAAARKRCEARARLGTSKSGAKSVTVGGAGCADTLSVKTAREDVGRPGRED